MTENKELTPEETQDIVQEVHERFPDTPWPEITAERIILSGMDYAVDNYKANCIWTKDSETPIVAAIVSENYKLIPYEVATKKFLDYLSKFGGLGTPTIGINIINEGRKIQVKADFIEHTHKIKKAAKVGDTVSMAAGFRHSIDTQWPYIVEAYAKQLVCSNGMIATKLNKTAAVKHKHSLNIDIQNATLQETIAQFPEQVKTWNHWAEININKNEAEMLIDDSFGKRHKDAILALPEVQSQETVAQWMKADKVNVFDLYSVMTQFMTHEIDSEMVRVQKAEKVANQFHMKFA